MVYAENKIKIPDQLNQVRFMMKARHDKDVINYIGVVYTETKIELLRPIWSFIVYDENNIRQWHDRLYRCGLRWN